MRIIIEGYPYKEQEIRTIVPERLLDFPNKNGEIKPPFVGYCYNPAINDCIFFLPKVVLTKDELDEKDITDKGLVFDRYKPEELLNFDHSRLDKPDKAFLQKFSIWIYRALKIFYTNHNTSIVSRLTISDVDSTARIKDGSLIDNYLSLIKFAKENRDFVMFEIKNIHSGYNRVNWRKTISHQLPIKQKKAPIYLNPINKKKQIDFDEELFVIYFSILEYIHRQYGFDVDINCNFETIKGSQFNHYLNGFGKTRLRQIKYKYFSDKALKLWTLCYTFFDNSDKLHSSKSVEDFIVAKNFETVFETMIDSLLGDEVPSGFKDQKDGKIIDHIYPYASLVNQDENIYHIADSKYYKVGSSIGRESIYKQFTYAKNVIQLTLDILFGRGTKEEKIKKGYLPYRDSLTEGYNITPNFFISAKIKKEENEERYSYSNDNLEPQLKNGEQVWHRMMQFENRIFDRDTLILTHYNINFLYLIALYGKDNQYEQESFRQKARRMFRSYVIKLINQIYEFYVIEPINESIENFVNKNFRELSGKFFHYDGHLILGLERDHKDSQIIYNNYKQILSIINLE